MIAAQEPDLQLDRSSRLLFHLLALIMEQRGAGGTAGGPGTANSRRTTDRLIDFKQRLFQAAVLKLLTYQM